MPAEASITVDASKKIAQLNRFIFGNFVEHIRDHMEALWAEVLSNRTFAADSSQAAGLPPPWVPVGAPMNAFVSGILPPRGNSETALPTGARIAGGKEPVGVAQLELVVRQGIPLEVSLRARAAGGAESVRIELTCPQAGVLAEATMQGIASEWVTFKTTVTPLKGSQHAAFKLTFRGAGTLEVAAVSIMPADAQGGVRAEVAHMSKMLRPTILRYPGGCFADTYHWRDGVGPRDTRPTTRNQHWGGIETNDFGADEFIRFCRTARSEPLLCVNFGSGTPEEAAQWVQYCNGGADTEPGALRAANGSAVPFGVRYWEIGNEIYGKWEAGHCDPRAYAHRYLEFRKAMKAVDPAIELLAVGHTDMEWNREVLSAAGEEIEHLTMHFYQAAPGGDSDARYKAMMAAPQKYAGLIAKAGQVIAEVCRSRRPKIAVTEWNTMYLPCAKRTMEPREHSLEAALFNAGLLNVFVRNCNAVSICNFSDLVNGWAGGCIRVGDYIADAAERRPEGWSGVRKDIVYGTPSYYVLSAYAACAGQVALETEVDSETYDTPEGEKTPAFQGVPLIDATATLSKDERELALFMVNRDRIRGIRTKITVANFAPDPFASVFIVTGDGPDDRNTPRCPDAVGLTRTHISDAASPLTYELAPCSLTVIVFRKAE